MIWQGLEMPQSASSRPELITQMDVTFHPVSKVTKKNTPKKVTQGRTWHTQILNVWYVYLHLQKKISIHVGINIPF